MNASSTAPNRFKKNSEDRTRLLYMLLVLSTVVCNKLHVANCRFLVWARGEPLVRKNERSEREERTEKRQREQDDVGTSKTKELTYI